MSPFDDLSARPMPIFQRYRDTTTTERAQLNFRVDAISEYWAIRLYSNYKEEALAHVMTKLRASMNHSPGIRFNIWSTVFIKLSKKRTENRSHHYRYMMSTPVHRILRRIR